MTATEHEDLSALLQSVMDEQQMKQTDIANATGLSIGTVNAWLHRQRGTGRGPSAKSLRKLAALPGVTERRAFEAAGRRVPGPLPAEREAELLRKIKELTAADQSVVEATIDALRQRANG